ncbi:MAG: carboxymuconolactone decarboxylase family protein [Cardiobacteriaceae bacterium]|nr:carboxymuconolactone decarboxylase family protein [Cardiobacteriaceae bacterium]
MLNWKEYKTQLTNRLREFSKLSPDTMQGYQGLAKANAESGVLDAKTRELIAMAVAITTRCDGCIAVHADAAKKAGASEQELAEALAVAVAMNAGAAMVYSARALDAFSSGQSS